MHNSFYEFIPSGVNKTSGYRKFTLEPAGFAVMALILCDSVIFSLALKVELAPVEFTPHTDRDKKRDRSPSAGEGDFVIWGHLRTLGHD